MGRMLKLCVLIAAFSATFAFANRIDQGSTASGHTTGCTEADPFGPGQTNPCIFFTQTSFGGIVQEVDGTFDSDGILLSTTLKDDVDVFYLNDASGAPVMFSSNGLLANPNYGAFLCGDGTTDGGIGNATMSGAPLCMNLSADDSASIFGTGDITQFNYDFTDPNLAAALTNNTLTFYVSHNAGTFSLEQSSAVPEPSSILLLATGASGLLVYRRKRQVKNMHGNPPPDGNSFLT
jgi:hypothetical protein